MKKSFAKFFILIFAVSACVPAAPMEELPSSTQSTEIPTAVSDFSPGPSPTPPSEAELLPTFSIVTLPTSDASSLPAQDPSSLPTVDLSSIPTLVPFTPWPTAISLPSHTPFYGSPEPKADCFATASKEGIQLRLGPSFSAYRLLPEMRPGVNYQVMDIHGQFYQLARDGVPVGWVQFIDVFPTEGLSTEGPGCPAFFERPFDARSLKEFPGLCLFAATSPTETFQDSTLTEPFFISISPSSGPFVGMWKTRKSIFTLLSHAGPSFFVPLDRVSTSGPCGEIPTSATVTAAGWLWSKPDESQGEKLLRLTVGIRLHIEGKRPPDTSGEPAWVQAVAEIQDESISGWVWSGLVTFD